MEIAKPSEMLNTRMISGIKKALLHKTGVFINRIPLKTMACLIAYFFTKYLHKPNDDQNLN